MNRQKINRCFLLKNKREMKTITEEEIIELYDLEIEIIIEDSEINKKRNIIIREEESLELWIDKVKKLKKSCISNQDFIMAGEWRDMERFLLSMIREMKLKRIIES